MVQKVLLIKAIPLIIPVIYETIVHFDGHIITLSKEEGADYFDINNMKYIYKESAE
jgi:hypothetical protein